MDRRLLALLLLALVPTVAAGPLACASPCHVESTSLAYVAPVTVVASGATVVYGSLDSTHIHADRPPVGGSAPECFAVASSRGSPAPGVRFFIEEGSLFAATPLDEDEEQVWECLNAQPQEDGSFVLPVHCKLHPVMRHTLVVTP